jgi:hypothetical protein
VWKPVAMAGQKHKEEEASDIESPKLILQRTHTWALILGWRGAGHQPADLQHALGLQARDASVDERRASGMKGSRINGLQVREHEVEGDLEALLRGDALVEIRRDLAKINVGLGAGGVLSGAQRLTMRLGLHGGVADARLKHVHLKNVLLVASEAIGQRHGLRWRTVVGLDLRQAHECP